MHTNDGGEAGCMDRHENSLTLLRVRASPALVVAPASAQGSILALKLKQIVELNVLT